LLGSEAGRADHDAAAGGDAGVERGQRALGPREVDQHVEARRRRRQITAQRHARCGFTAGRDRLGAVESGAEAQRRVRRQRVDQGAAHAAGGTEDRDLGREGHGGISSKGRGV